MIWGQPASDNSCRVSPKACNRLKLQSSILAHRLRSKYFRAFRLTMGGQNDKEMGKGTCSPVHTIIQYVCTLYIQALVSHINAIQPAHVLRPLGTICVGCGVFSSINFLVQDPVQDQFFKCAAAPRIQFGWKVQDRNLMDFQKSATEFHNPAPDQCNSPQGLVWLCPLTLLNGKHDKSVLI